MFICFQIIKGASNEPEGFSNRDARERRECGKLDWLLLERLEKTIELSVCSTI
jgi:hypothetical protein